MDEISEGPTMVILTEGRVTLDRRSGIMKMGLKFYDISLWSHDLLHAAVDPL